MICAVVTENSVEGMVKEASACDCDLVELRLDYLKKHSNLREFSKIKKPKIATCMPSWEGGKFTEDEEKRFKILEEALDSIEYVTVELKANPKRRDALIRKAKEKKVKVIVAYHNFEETPSLSGMTEILKKEEECGADIAKIAFKPEKEEDVLNTLHTLVEKNLSIPLIAISMGELGKLSRILGPLLGSYLTYGYSSSRVKASASGQLSVSELKAILGNLRGCLR